MSGPNCPACQQRVQCANPLVLALFASLPDLLFSRGRCGRVLLQNGQDGEWHALHLLFLWIRCGLRFLYDMSATRGHLRRGRRHSV
eukprot:scaffold773_cov114-Isochrysis_galbana.AAC.9